MRIDRRSADAATLRADVLAAWDGELSGHFRAEEEILFPALRGRIASEGLVDQLIAEHRTLEAGVARVRDCPEGERLEALQEFGRALAAHIRAEERRLFEEAQAALSVEELAELGERLEPALTRYCPIQD